MIKGVTLFITGILVGYLLTSSPRLSLLSNNPEPEPTDKTDNSDGLAKHLAQIEKLTIDVPAKYFETKRTENFSDGKVILRGIFVSEIPEKMDPADESIKNEPYKELPCPTDNLGPCPRTDRPGPKIDIDKDGKLEQVFYVSTPETGSNHGGGDIWIVKDGYVIFKSGDSPGLGIKETTSGKGFYLTYDTSSFLGVPAEIIVTRYVYEDGKIFPVWRQHSYELLSREE